MVENTKGAESFAQEFEEYEKSLITLNTRDVVKGIVMGVSEKGISVNLGYKSDGFVPAGEVTDDPTADITSMYKVGDEVEENQVLAVIEAMKMETSVTAPKAGKIKEVLISGGQAVKAKELLIIME